VLPSLIPPMEDEEAVYFKTSPDLYPWLIMLIWSRAVFTPTEVVLLSLFEYPDPELSTIILDIILFLSKDWIRWTPSPKAVKFTVFIPEMTSPTFLYSFIVDASIVST